MLRHEAVDHVCERVSSASRLLSEFTGACEAEPEPVAPCESLKAIDFDDGADAASVLYENLLRQRAASDRSRDDDSVALTPERPRTRSSLISFRQDPSRGDASQSTIPSRPNLPALNDQVFGFRLLRELGSGAFAKVFLARQGDLANREVVLKVSAIEGVEPQTLAQLQHTHVVPIYSVHEDARIGLRAVCMPYFGGACLARVLERAWEKEKDPPLTGAAFLAALDQVSGPSPATRSRTQRSLPRSHRTAGSEAPERATGDTETVPTTGALAKPPQVIEPAAPAAATSSPPTGSATSSSSPDHAARALISSRTYVQTVVWTVARLAEGLQHAHDRGVVHRDIKPSNILISADGQPLLLDFNVSQAADCAAEDATLGGTLAYMAPEHLRAVIARNVDLAARVDERSDVYSLGLVLYEMLCGRSPFDQSPTCSIQHLRLEAMACERSRDVPALRGLSPLEIPWGLQSIVQRALAPQPEQRYASAAQLREDLERFLHDLPLKFAPELSRVERVRKWTRRHPRALTSASIVAVALCAIVPVAFALHGTLRSLASTSSQLTAAQALETARAFHEGTLRSLCLIKTSTAGDETLTAGLDTCAATLRLYHMAPGHDWQSSEAWQRLPAAEQSRVAQEARELILVLAAARTRGSTDEPVLRDALRWLDCAENIPGLARSRAVWLDRARYLARLGETAQAESAVGAAASIPARSAYDLYLLAGAHARQSTREGYRVAISLLTQAVELDRQHYWSVFERSLCHQELGETLLAATDLGTCIGLWPQSPWAHFNRAYLLEREGRRAEAIADYTAAIAFDPRFRSAYFNRGLTHLELKHFALARADFERVAELGRNDALLGAARAMALEGLGRHAEADDLFARSLAMPAAGDSVRLRWAFAFSVSARRPDLAASVFESILDVDPRQPQALYGQAMLAMRADRLERAVTLFDQALAAAPAFAEPRRYRAVCLARQGECQLATDDINLCLERAPTQPENLYAAACVAALAARRLRSPELKVQALSLLEQALGQGIEPGRAAEDIDFSSLRGDPRFEELTKSHHDMPPPRADA